MKYRLYTFRKECYLTIRKTTTI